MIDLRTRHLAALMGALCVTCAASTAAAFCGTFVSGADAELYNSATQVVLMRHGEQTILSMENDYQGPLDDFAMVVPVPQIMMEGDVKTLDPIVFRKIDVLGSPRLVEYAEKNPCVGNVVEYDDSPQIGCGASPEPVSIEFSDANNGGGGGQAAGPPPPVIEAEFEVGEYEVVILSAEDSTGLEIWLDANGYTLPDGADAVLEGYVQRGMYFFVAKVDVTKVVFDENDRALLSPLRFAYTSEDFALPIRLGLLNSSGEQDLIVNILSTEGRYEASNYPSVHIPTNQLVVDQTREGFGAFYDKLFSRTLAENPGAIVTEYAWSWTGFQQGNKCDPCPPPPEGATGSLDEQDLSALGNDIVANLLDPNEPWFGWTLTRLHARYGKSGVDEDLMFSLQGNLIGGAGTAGRDQFDTAEEERHNPGAQRNRFQGRYIIHNVWDGAIECEDPVRGRWIGAGEPEAAPSRASTGEVADIPGMSLDDFYADAEEIPATGEVKYVARSGCASSGSRKVPASGLLLLSVLGVVGVRRRLRR